ncbi:sigma-70 family RNA polymerase sigma factor [Rhodococcus opacus]|uniref:sigma-70 family RNA polymerase sigma factor n=1 Tax=Rhodococcus opacus TaxID=37919 RepID=UPI002949177E|nr:sigma-70 family RNA polymerase sigma factor [Rhodococcus opacus]MDV6244851.1 sigma-70 family RNA polymerase sigma factor [Rhodococcus opacus]
MRLISQRRRAGGLGDESALRAAYEDHAGELFRFAHRSLGDAGGAEEAVQETFLRAWRAAHSFQPDTASLRTWLFSICRNIVIDINRARASRPPLTGTEPIDAPSAARPLEELVVGLQVEEALSRLSEQHRQVLVEVHLRDRPAAEVAAALGIPEGTVRSRVYYGLQALKLVLEEMGWQGEY